MSELGLVSEFGIYVPETAKTGNKKRPFRWRWAGQFRPPVMQWGKEGHSPLAVRRRALRGGVSKMHPFYAVKTVLPDAQPKGEP